MISEIDGKTPLSSNLGSVGFVYNDFVYNDDDVLNFLKVAIEREGSQVAFAKHHGINRTFLNMVLKGKRPVGDAVVEALGLHRVYAVSSLVAEGSRLQSELRDLSRSKQKLMESSTFEEIAEKSVSTKSGAEVRDSVERENSKPVQRPLSKVGVDAERLRSCIAKLTSDSTKELDKLINELEALRELLKSETGRVGVN